MDDQPLSWYVGTEVIEELMSHGSWCWRHLVIVDEQHWAEVKGWRKQWHVVDQAKSRRRHRRYYEGQLFVGPGLVHGLAAEKSVESGCFNGSQSCDQSDILLLEDNSNQHHTIKYPLIDMTSWTTFSATAFSATWDFVEPLFYHFHLIWWIASDKECQSQQNSFNHHKFPLPIVRIEIQEWLFPFKYDQVSSQLRCAGLSKVKRDQKFGLHHIFWSTHNQIKDQYSIHLRTPVNI